MTKNRTLIIVILAFAGMSFGTAGRLAKSKPPQSDSPDIDSMIQSLRADVRADKVAIITQTMQFTDQQSAIFWPIYRNYENDLSKLNDDKVSLIKSYAQKYDTITDADAKSMADQFFSIESRHVDLQKKYYAEFNAQLPATVVTKFFQLEHRLDLIIDLKLASELPALFLKPAASSPGR
jgi:hypothetical protein